MPLTAAGSVHICLADETYKGICHRKVENPKRRRAARAYARFASLPPPQGEAPKAESVGAGEAKGRPRKVAAMFKRHWRLTSRVILWLIVQAIASVVGEILFEKIFVLVVLNVYVVC